MRPFRALLGPLVALAAVAAIEALAWTPFRIPNAPAVVLLAVVFSAFVSGLWPGLFTAVGAWAYFAYFFSIHGQSGQLFVWSADDFRRVVIWAAATPAVALMVGTLHRRATTWMERALRESQTRERSILASALDAVVLMDREGRIVEFNPAAERMFGHSRDEVVGMRKDGAEFPVELSIVPIHGDGPPVFTGFIRDITERKRAEEALVRSESMAAVGRLSSQVAHEINNPLTIATGYLERIKAKSAGDPALAEMVERVERSVARVANLTRDLLGLARTSRMEMGTVELPPLLEELRDHLRVDFENHGVRVEWQVPPGLPPIRGSGEHLRQAFMNLFLNARQAMDGGGTLTVGGSASDGEVRVTVADTGVGIPPDNRERLFEPFFTTKPKGEGTGLGLTICHSIVAQHRGRIEVESEPGKGSTFTVVLPATSPGEGAP